MDPAVFSLFPVNQILRQFLPNGAFKPLTLERNQMPENPLGRKEMSMED